MKAQPTKRGNFLGRERAQPAELALGLARELRR